MSTSSVDGLVSGLNTSQLISQLMQVEAAPQQALRQKVSVENAVIAAYQSVNTKMSALQSAADTLTLADTWKAVKATSSSDAVVATATTGAATGNFTFDVTALARAQVTTASVSSTGAVTTGSGLDISIGGGTATHIAVTTDTAQGVADAVNAANIGVRAAVVTTSTGTVLQFTGSKTGVANAFTVSGLSSPTTDVTTAADAQIQVGNPAAGGYTVNSSSNTFTNVLSGVTLTVNRLQTGVTVSVDSDVDGMASKIQAMVDATNNALDEITNQTKYDASSNRGSTLTSDYTVRELQEHLLSAVSDGQTGYGSFSQFGVQLDKDGKLTFDKNAFVAAYHANPTSTVSAVQTGLAKSLDDIGKGATDFTTGSLTLAIQGGNSLIKTFTDEITDWDARLQAKREGLQKQFADLEVALGKMKDQSSWLSGQIAGLPTGK